MQAKRYGGTRAGGGTKAAALLNWYDAHARDLPWRVKNGRVKNGRQDPYKVWLSEIMLQQTTVGAVKAYFEKFVTTWPTVAALAAADRDDIMRAWAGLGYYSRARNLHICAQTVLAEHGGQFPETVDALLKLPGVGPYTAAAIAAIAFDVPVAAVDGNVDRVISRVYAIEEPLPTSKPRIRALAQALVPQKRAGDFAQAMMDLGATICTPKSPNCLICPWTDDCDARAQGIAATLPRKASKKPVPTRRAYIYWLERPDGSVLIRKRPDRGLLGGMMEFPSSPWEAELPGDFHTHAPVAAEWRKVRGLVEHTFTHFHLELTVMRAVTEAKVDGVWVTRRDLHAEALPTVMRKVVTLVLNTESPVMQTSVRPLHRQSRRA
jgi:A/G-specific adenine glycosylase